MMQRVVLAGTGKKATLNGYSVAGKTGTSQKVDAATGTYSHRKHVASFAGFAPVNNPAVTVLVILDTPIGPQDGGMVAAPVFSRVTQQILSYLNVPHDIEFQDTRSVTLRAQVKPEEMVEGAPDRIVAEAEPAQTPAPPPNPNAGQETRSDAKLVSAAYKPDPDPVSAPAAMPPPLAPVQARGTIVLDVAGGVVVPNFVGKPLRTVLEEAQAQGIELEVSGSGTAQSQSPAAGYKIPHGGRVSVTFGR